MFNVYSFSFFASYNRTGFLFR